MNLVQKALSKGGQITPLILPAELTGGLGIMNPSIFVDNDGDILCIIRALNVKSKRYRYYVVKQSATCFLRIAPVLALPLKLPPNDCLLM